MEDFGPCDVFCASFTADIQGGEIGGALKSIAVSEPCMVLADFPQQAPFRSFASKLHDWGYGVITEPLTSSAGGDPVARTRHMMRSAQNFLALL